MDIWSSTEEQELSRVLAPNSYVREALRKFFTAKSAEAMRSSRDSSACVPPHHEQAVKSAIESEVWESILPALDRAL